MEWDERTTGIFDAQIARMERLDRDIRQLTTTEEATVSLQLTLQDPGVLAAQAVATIEPAAAAKNISVTASGASPLATPVLLDPALRSSPCRPSAL